MIGKTFLIDHLSIELQCGGWACHLADSYHTCVYQERLNSICTNDLLVLAIFIDWMTYCPLHVYSVFLY